MKHGLKYQVMGDWPHVEGSAARSSRWRAFSLWLPIAALLLVLLSGCASSHAPTPHRTFDFQKDTFAYPNELLWEYGFDTNGHWSGHAPEKKKEGQYALRCFVVARSAAQFFKFARFDPAKCAVDQASYRGLIRQVVKKNPRRSVPERERIVIPGYADLRSFSAAHEKLLKEECGGLMQSYFQRGHWRMVLPFTRGHQQHAANRLVNSIHEEGIAVVHLVRFPSLKINHAILLFGAEKNPEEIAFSAYDPNAPSQPNSLYFRYGDRTFIFPRNNYFPGGPLNVYQVYHRWDY